MVQFKILSGKMAGAMIAARHFPWQIGRGAESDCKLEEAGIWDRHLVLTFDSAEGFLLNVQLQALAAINGQPFLQRILRNGDLIEIGPVKMQFWLGGSRLANLKVREAFLWLLLGSITVGQLGVIFWLLK